MFIRKFDSVQYSPMLQIAVYRDTTSLGSVLTNRARYFLHLLGLEVTLKIGPDTLIYGRVVSLLRMGSVLANRAGL